jgi:hypothetical protein
VDGARDQWLAEQWEANVGEGSRDDIRQLVKEFGGSADGAIAALLARVAGAQPLRLRCTLEDLTEYGGEAPSQRLHLEVEGTVRRQAFAGTVRLQGGEHSRSGLG